MANIVGERFQITIDKTVRRRLGIKPGDLAVERVEDGRLIVDFIPGPKRESLFGIFRREGVPPLTDWQDLRERTWTERQREQAARGTVNPGGLIPVSDVVARRRPTDRVSAQA